jgi:hypothetical protein
MDGVVDKTHHGQSCKCNVVSMEDENADNRRTGGEVMGYIYEVKLIYWWLNIHTQDQELMRSKYSVNHIVVLSFS